MTAKGEAKKRVLVELGAALLIIVGLVAVVGVVSKPEQEEFIVRPDSQNLVVAGWDAASNLTGNGEYELDGGYLGKTVIVLFVKRDESEWTLVLTHRSSSGEDGPYRHFHLETARSPAPGSPLPAKLVELLAALDSGWIQSPWTRSTSASTEQDQPAPSSTFTTAAISYIALAILLCAIAAFVMFRLLRRQRTLRR